MKISFKNHIGIGLHQNSHYTTFGSPIPGRQFTSSSGYRYGFNGMEKDDEVKGEGNSLDFGARIYDSRLGRWLSLDPSMKKYPSESAYNFSHNSPIALKDPDGEDPITAFIDAITAFAVDAAFSYVGNLIDGKNAQEAFDDIDWGSASVEAAKGYALSFFISGVGSVKAIEKLATSKVGKITSETVVNFTAELVKKYNEGAFNDNKGEFDISLVFDGNIMKQALQNAVIEALVSQGMSKKADELKEKFQKSIKEVQKNEDKLAKQLNSNTAPKATIEKRMNKVDEAQKNMVKKAGKYTANKAKGEAAESGSQKGVDAVEGKVVTLRSKF